MHSIAPHSVDCSNKKKKAVRKKMSQEKSSNQSKIKTRHGKKGQIRVALTGRRKPRTRHT